MNMDKARDNINEDIADWRKMRRLTIVIRIVTTLMILNLVLTVLTAGQYQRTTIMSEGGYALMALIIGWTLCAGSLHMVSRAHLARKLAETLLTGLMHREDLQRRSSTEIANLSGAIFLHNSQIVEMLWTRGQAGTRGVSGRPSYQMDPHDIADLISIMRRNPHMIEPILTIIELEGWARENLNWTERWKRDRWDERFGPRDRTLENKGSMLRGMRRMNSTNTKVAILAA